jgi:type 1 glutamine amidotransferase
MKPNSVRLCALLLTGALAASQLFAQPPAPDAKSAAAPAQPGRRGGRGRGAAEPQSNKKRLLIWADTRNGIAQHESVSHAMAIIERLGYDSGLYTSFIRTDSNIIARRPLMTTGQPASGGPSLASADAIFFLGHREIELNESQRAELLAFVHDDGKGFVAGHTATTAFNSWPEFGEMLGGFYDGHPWGMTRGTVINEDPAFPATKHFPATFDVTEEFYQTKQLSRDKVRVLLRLDTSKLPPNPGVHLTNGDFPIAWAKSYGKGRVFYATFAHADAGWDNPEVQKMYFEAIKWALRLTDADITPRPFTAPAARPAGQ